MTGKPMSPLGAALFRLGIKMSRTYLPPPKPAITIHIKRISTKEPTNDK